MFKAINHVALLHATAQNNFQLTTSLIINFQRTESEWDNTQLVVI